VATRKASDVKADLDKMRQDIGSRPLTEAENKRVAALLQEIKDLEKAGVALTEEQQAKRDRWAAIDKTPKEQHIRHPFREIKPGNYIYHAGESRHNLSAVVEAGPDGLVVKLNGQADGQPLSSIPKYGVFVPAPATAAAK
jgi:hypothetical protein